MKTITECGKYWTEPDGNSLLLGFSPDYMARLGVVWVFAPKGSRAIQEGMPFASIESSKFLGPLRAPMTAKIEAWNEEALLKPESLTSESYLLKVKLNAKETEVK